MIERKCWLGLAASVSAFPRCCRRRAGSDAPADLARGKAMAQANVLAPLMTTTATAGREAELQHNASRWPDWEYSHKQIYDLKTWRWRNRATNGRRELSAADVITFRLAHGHLLDLPTSNAEHGRQLRERPGAARRHRPASLAIGPAAHRPKWR